MKSQDQKPPRPLGVTLAIVTSTVVFSFWPAMLVLLVVTINQRVDQACGDLNSLLPEAQAEQFVCGSNFAAGFTIERLLLQIGISIAFLLIAFFAWRGRPPVMRFVLMGTVVLLPALTIIASVLPVLNGDSEGASGGSSDWLLSSFQWGHLVTLLLVPLYVIWYLNRGPARAFYRGRYIEAPQEHPAEKQEAAT